MASPKTWGSYTPKTTADGAEIIPFAETGANGTLLSGNFPVSTPQQTAMKLRGAKTQITVGRTGSGADYECDGTADDVQINAAITAAASSPNPAEVFIMGYGYVFEYNITAPLVLLSTSTGGELVNVRGVPGQTVLQVATGYSGDVFISQNFYTEINSNYNSYSRIGNGKISGLIIEGNSSGGTVHTICYSTLSAFPSTGVAGKMYVALDTDLGYTWSGSAYVTTSISGSGAHWRAYAYHLIKIYGYHYVVEDCYLRDALEFAYYSEQTNTDTTIFNDYSTMESALNRVDIVGYELGGINWLGPHDSSWTDVHVHTNEYSTNALYNIYAATGPNFNGGGLVWRNVHPWGPTSSTGYNVRLESMSVRGDAYIEGGSNIGLYANNSSVSLDLVVTNNAVNVQLNNCYNVRLDIINYYQFNTLGTMVKLVGNIKNSQINVHNVDTTNLSGSSKVFDITGVTSSSNVKLWARIPYATTAITPGVTVNSLDASSEIDVIQGTSAANTTNIIKRVVASSAIAPAALTANYTLTVTDTTVIMDATAASRTVTLPSAATYAGPGFFIKRLDATYASGNTVGIATVSSQTIDGAASPLNITTNGSGYRLQTNGTNWVIVGKV